MSRGSEGESQRQAAWDNFYRTAAEIAVRHSRRTEATADLQARGHTQEDFDAADRALAEYDQAMRQLRRAMKAVPDLVGESGCDVQIRELRRQLDRLNAVWREAKLSWRDNRPRVT